MTIHTHQPQADALVLFGATGDLAKRKLFPALYHLERRGQLTVPVIGVARSDWTDDDFKAHADESIRDARRGRRRRACIAALQRAARPRAGRLRRHGHVGDACGTRSTRHGSEVAVYYMAIPPSMFPTVAEALASVGLHRARPHRGREAVRARPRRRPQQLNDTLHSIFPEERIFRIDHYLGKEAVEDLLVFRFSNMLLEPVWNRNYVRSVQITMAETIGVEGRGSFYDSVGAIRDVFQNHLLQVVALLAMEPPVGPDSFFLQDEKCEGAGGDDADRPRRVGARASTTATSTRTASPSGLDRRRRSSPPRCSSTRGAGRACRGTSGSARRWRPTSPRPSSSCASRRKLLFDEAGGPPPGRNLIRFRLGSNDGVTFALQAKTPGPHLDSQEVDLRVDFAAALGERQEAYERLLDDAIDGSARRFAREDIVEQDVAHRAARPRPAGAGAPLPQGIVGPRRGRLGVQRRSVVQAVGVTSVMRPDLVVVFTVDREEMTDPHGCSARNERFHRSVPERDRQGRPVDRRGRAGAVARHRGRAARPLSAWPTARKAPSCERTVAKAAAAKDRFIRANLRLVVSIARRYPLPQGMDLGDVIQEGNLGLEHAVDKFDWRRGIQVLHLRHVLDPPGHRPGARPEGQPHPHPR